MKKKLIKSISLLTLATSSLGLVSCSSKKNDYAFDWNEGPRTSMREFINDIKKDSGQFSKTDNVIYNDSINLLFKSNHSASEFNAFKSEAQKKMNDQIKNFKKADGHDWKSKWVKSLKSKGFTNNGDYLDSLITASIEGVVKADFGYTMETKSLATIKDDYKDGLTFTIKGINLKNSWNDTANGKDNLPGITYDQATQTSTVTLTAQDIIDNFTSDTSLINGDHYVMNKFGIKAFYIYNIVNLPVSVQHSLVKFSWFPSKDKTNNFGEEPSMATADIKAMFFTLQAIEDKSHTQDLSSIATSWSEDTGSGAKKGYLGSVNLLKSSYVPGFIDGMYNKIINGDTGSTTKAFPITLASYEGILNSSGAIPKGTSWDNPSIWKKFDDATNGAQWKKNVATAISRAMPSFASYYTLPNRSTAGDLVNVMVSKDGFHFFNTEDNPITMLKSDLNQKVNNVVSSTSNNINYGVLDKFSTWLGGSKYWFEMNALNLVKDASKDANDTSSILPKAEYDKFTSKLINTNVLSVLITNIQSFISGNQTWMQNNANSEIKWTDTKWANTDSIRSILNKDIPEIQNF